MRCSKPARVAKRSPLVGPALALAILAASLTLAATALAENQSPAREAFASGVAAFQAADYPTALARFREADALHAAPAITYNIARTLEKLERPDAAVRAYETYIATAGEAGEFTRAAKVAIAQIKASSTRLRIDSQPPGATIAVDGEDVPERTPVAILVGRGAHRIELELGSWHESRTYDAPGGGVAGELVFVRSPTPPGAPAPPADRPSPSASTRAASSPPELDNLVGSFGLSLSLYRFVGEAEQGAGDERVTAESSPTGLVFGLAFDVGWALSGRSAILLRSFGGLGSSEGALASVGAGGTAFAYRLSPNVWFGAGIAFGSGRADSNVVNADTSQITVATDLALGPTLELGYVLHQYETGQWLVEILPTTLLSTSGSPSTLFVPLVVGYRWF